MTITNLLTGAARADAQDARELQARVEALLANSKPQKFTPPGPEPKHLVVEYHHEAGYDTRDILATTLTRTDEEVI